MADDTRLEDYEEEEEKEEKRDGEVKSKKKKKKKKQRKKQRKRFKNRTERGKKVEDDDFDFFTKLEIETNPANRMKKALEEGKAEE